MGKKVKKLKYKQPNGTFSEPIPIGVDAANVDLADGKNVEQVLGEVFTADGTVGMQLSRLRENVNAAIFDINGIKSNYVTKNGDEIEAANFSGQWNRRWAVLDNIGHAHTYYNNLKNQIPTMGFLSIWNGAYDNENRSNLEYCKTGRIQAAPTIIAQPNSKDSFDLSQPIKNFKTIEIIYKDDWEHQASQTIYTNHKNNAVYTDLVCFRLNGGNNSAMIVNGACYKFEGSRATKDYSGGYNSYGNSFSQNSNQITILAVIGWTF